MLRIGVHSTTAETYFEILLPEDERMSMCDSNVVQLPHNHVKCLWLHASAPAAHKIHTAPTCSLYSKMPSIVAQKSLSNKATLLQAQPSPSTLCAPAKYISTCNRTTPPSTLRTRAPSPVSPNTLTQYCASSRTTLPRGERAPVTRRNVVSGRVDLSEPAFPETHIASGRLQNRIISPSVHKVKEASRPMLDQHCGKLCQHNKRKTRRVTLSTIFKSANENFVQVQDLWGR